MTAACVMVEKFSGLTWARNGTRSARPGCVLETTEENWQAGHLPLDGQEPVADEQRIAGRDLQAGGLLLECQETKAGRHRTAVQNGQAGEPPPGVSRQKPAGKEWQARTGIKYLLKSEWNLVPKTLASNTC